MFKITELREKQLDSDYFLFNPVKKQQEKKKKNCKRPEMFSQPVAQLMWFFKWKVTIIGKVMDFLQTKSKPWSHSLFIYLFTYLFSLLWRKWGRRWAGGGKLLVLWRGRGRKSKAQKVSPQGNEPGIGTGRGRGGCTDTQGQGQTTFGRGGQV